MKKIISIVLCAAMLLVFASCGKKDDGGSNGDEKVLRVAALKDIATMDVAQTTEDYFIPQNVFDRPVSYTHLEIFCFSFQVSLGPTG